MEQLQIKQSSSNWNCLFEWVLMILLILLTAAPSKAASKEGVKMNGTNDYILIPNNYNLIGDRTFSFWINHSSSNHQNEYILFKAFVFSISLDNSSNKLIVQWGNGKNWESTVLSNGKISKNKWTHITITKSFAAHQTAIFINGKQDLMAPTSNAYAVNNYPVVIGAAIVDGRIIDCFSGQMKELQIWNKTFCNHYVEQTNKARIDLTEHGLVGYYKLSKDKIINKGGLFEIALSEFQGTDGIMLHQPVNQNADRLAKASNSSNLPNNPLLNLGFLQPEGAKQTIEANLGVNMKNLITHDSFRVNVQHDPSNFYKLNVYTVMGEEVFSSDYFIGEQEQTFGQDLSPGVYMLDVSKGHMVQRLKILKQ